MLLRISAPHFVAGIECYSAFGCHDYDDNPTLIHRTAPILKYMKGWTVHRIQHYCHRKGWIFESFKEVK